MKTVALSILIFLTTFKGQAQNTGLDPTFANNGIMIHSISLGWIRDIKLQSDQKIVTAGGTGRYQTNGTSDPTFSGIVSSLVMAIQPDDKILGGNYNQLLRKNADGTSDASFGDNGSVLNSVIVTPGAILVQPDSKIVIVGTGHGDTHDSTIGTQEAVILIRYLSDGRIDSSFGENGVVTDAATTQHFGFEAKGAALQPDGKIVVGINESTTGGGSFTATRYMPDGKLDTSFGEAGYARAEGLELLNAIALQPDGKIALAGADFGAQGDPQGVPFVLVRFNADGGPDNTLAPNGVRLYYWEDGGDANKCRDIIALPDNKLLLGGRAWDASKEGYDFALLRLLPNGNPDSGFGTNGKLLTKISSTNDGIWSLALQADGKILSGGSSGCEGASLSCPSTLVRYMSDGKTALNDPELDSGSFILYPNPTKDKVHVKGIAVTQETVLSDIAGKVLHDDSSGSNEISLQHLGAGVYILSVTDVTNHTERFKIIKQ